MHHDAVLIYARVRKKRFRIRVLNQRMCVRTKLCFIGFSCKHVRFFGLEMNPYP
jgi:hypothetical protein